jgi:uncharacterized damage-inducible protein DinB
MEAALSLAEIMEYTAEETRRWHRWFAEHPAALDVSMGAGSAQTVRDLVHHVFLVERRYAERLLGEPVTEADTPPGAPAALFAAFGEARTRLERFVETASPDDWRAVHDLHTRTAGVLHGSARKVVVHALLHGIRHWAQVASALRQAGFPPQWPHDVLFHGAVT